MLLGGGGWLCVPAVTGKGHRSTECLCGCDSELMNIFFLIALGGYLNGDFIFFLFLNDVFGDYRAKGAGLITDYS